ncbi:MAG TPA: hypothetical protein VMY05_03915 [Acidobacteriota bacterium]|nr:hypothetical protein [Acidobacteriota bacterium]
MRAVIVVLVVVLIVCFLGFVVYNASERVNINKQPFAQGTFHNVALAEVVFWALAAGVVLSTLVFLLIYIRQSVQLHSSRKRVRALESEVTLLRNRPIEESAELLKGADNRSRELKNPFDEGGQA